MERDVSWKPKALHPTASLLSPDGREDRMEQKKMRHPHAGLNMISYLSEILMIR